MKTAKEIMDAAIADHDPVAIYVGFSGGRDSLAVTHWVMSNYPRARVFHANTGIGVEATRAYVRETCKKQGWPLDEIRAKEDCGQDYDQIILENGFPGPFGHRFMYVRLKERCIDALTRKAKKRRSDRVMFCTGIRHDESVRRMAYAGQETQRYGAKVWVSPIYWWGVAERDSYIDSTGIEVNPVSTLLGMSGECACGAFSHKGEKEMLRIADPALVDRIERLEAECLKRGFTWGWEGSPPAGGHNPAQKTLPFQPLCVGCTK